MSVFREEDFNIGFTKFITYSLRVIFSIIFIASIGMLGYFIIARGNKVSILLTVLYTLFTFFMYIGIKKNINKRMMIGLTIMLGLFLRIIWAFSLHNIPVSDFNQIYEAAININKGDYSALKGLKYFGRFPHLIIIILYFSKILTMFGNNTLVALKSINIIFSTSSILVTYFILNEIFEEYSKVVVGTFIAALFPASILYTSVYCGENIAILFYLLSIYFFIIAMKAERKTILLICCGFLLFIGHLFRMVAQIMIISYVLYIFIYNKEKYMQKFKNTFIIIMSFIIPFIITGNLLVYLGITDRKLWNGSEPNITSVLKGSNINHIGRWNKEDAEFINKNLNNKEYLESESKKIIVDRYTNTNVFKVAIFEVCKMSMQWRTGDSGGSFWSQLNLGNDKVKIDIVNEGNSWYQLFYIIILFMIIRGLLTGLNEKKEIINLFLIIFCGYACTFLILEAQERYSFIISWVFVIISVQGLYPIEKTLFKSEHELEETSISISDDK